LAQVLGQIEIPRHPALLVGVETMDDAGVVKVRDDLALVQTLDVFPPVVDDPYWFGRIAAANSLSDVYAMGGVPVAAVNFVGYPMAELGGGPLQEILRGAFDALEEADCAMAGGHSIKDSEVKFGLAVVGTVHPDHVVTNAGAQPGDLLVLTKPLGMGCLTTALKQGATDEAHVDAAQHMMARLNRHAAEAMLRVDAHAATDITGYGLLGHAWEMAEGAGVTLCIDSAKVPVLEEAKPYLKPQFTCGGSARNREFADERVTIADSVPDATRLVLHDVQTSGGLLIAVAAEFGERLLEDLRAGGDDQAAIVGDVQAGGPKLEIR
jgi:selenide,water dikinase